MRRCRLSPPSRRRRHSEYVLVFRRAPDALDEDVVHPLARPSVEMRTPASISTPMKSALVNRLPWSMLKVRGLPYLASASSTAATRKGTGSSTLMTRCRLRARASAKRIFSPLKCYSPLKC
jgi:hypothetical protein